MIRDLRFMLLAALMLFGLGAGTVWYWLSDDLATKDAQIDGLKEAQKQAAMQRKKDQATLATRTREKAALEAVVQSKQAALDQALRNQQAWADQPVPEEVRRALD